MTLFGQPIDKFDGTQFAFLSNFYVHNEPIMYNVLQDDGIYRRYFVNTVEHVYQADKCMHSTDYHKILMAATPARAKKYGRMVECRSDWDLIKIARMKHWLKVKFSTAYLANRLIEETEDRPLIEGNTWGDRFWGQVNGVGENWLGRLLEEVRKELKRND